MLKEGDIIELRKGHEVYADIPERFVYSNKKGSFVLTRHRVVLDEQFAYLCGRYVVYKTSYDGGGTGHGLYDNYPDGHHVFCERLDDLSIRVDFYQSGSFTAVIKKIDLIGQAKRKWVDMEEIEFKD